MKVLTYIKSNNLNAGPKAERDIIKILDNSYDNSKFDTIFFANKYILAFKKFFLILRNIFSNNLILQYPITHSRLLKLLPKNTIILIHDLNSIRDPKNKKNLKELDNLKHFNYIICHNDKMKEYLVSHGINENYIYKNELFDYICNKEVNVTDKFNNNIVYAGNMTKSPFINQLDENKLKYNICLYGQGIDTDINNKVLYKGKFQPEDLPQEWSGSVGLVWDGNFDESDENEGFKNYTKYNNPHKLSCYIAAGLPVIVWKQAAVADFVLKNNIGYVISNIYDINNIDFSDYAEKKKNVSVISERVRNGYYTQKVIDEIKNRM